MPINPSPDRISMISIGERLKAAREKKSMTLDQVQKHTRIYSAVLGALEEGRCDEMLTVVYVKGFLKKYADYLGLDSHAMLKEYDILHSMPPRQIQEPQQQPQKEVPGAPILQPKTSIRLKTATTYLTAKKIKFAVILILAILLIIFIGKKIGGSSKRVIASRKIKVAQVKTAAPAMQKAQPTKSLPPETPPKPEAPKNLPLNLELYVKKPVTVKVKVDGVLRFGRYLAKGTRESLTAKDSINIYVTKAESLELTLNGSPLPIAAKGLVRDLEITRKGVKIR